MKVVGITPIHTYNIEFSFTVFTQADLDLAEKSFLE